MKSSFLTLRAWSALLLMLPAGSLLGAPPVDFASDVYPVFERACLSCHGEKQQMGRLRLDSQEAAAKALKPGDSGASELYKRIAGIGEQARMPMGGQLPLQEIAAIKNWIDQGAVWPDGFGIETAGIQQHWAFVKPKRPAQPTVQKQDWVRNAIDSFILARLEKENLTPSPEADKATLLRRVSLDLIGLPPTLQELDAFLADKSPNAYKKQVERLLASPHYGERWGRHWLDSARYADSDGYEKDKMREVWFYRDWVIQALNRDLPYDRFIIEQLAGDLLPNKKQDSQVATGFLRNSMVNEEGGIDPEQFRMEAMFDRMDAIGKSVLGLTIQCAQCHNHKYDPVKQAEYYKLFAFLNNSHESNIAVYTPKEQQKRAEIFRHIREMESELQHRTPDWQEQMAAWEAKVREDQPQWTTVEPDVDDISTGGQKYLMQHDGSMLASGYAPTRHRVQFTIKTDLKDIRAFRLELLTDPNLPLGGPGRSVKGTGALTEFEVEAAPADKPDQKYPVRWAKATADVNPPSRPLDDYALAKDPSKDNRVVGPIDYAIDDCEDTAWTLDAGPGRTNQPRKAVFTALKPISHENGTILTIYLSQKHGGWNSDNNQNNNLGRMRLSITSDPDAVADPLPAHVREILAIPMAKRTPAQQQAVFAHWRTTVPEWNQVNARIESLWQEHPEGSAQLVLNERDRMRDTHLLERGDFLKPKETVEPDVPAFLHDFPEDAPRNRLGFAQWLVSRESPTTARSVVNRIWQNYFGTGIVETSEDLGTQSAPPSHPELLDWLAVEFMDNGWKLKDLHRLIVTSATYRQSSNVTPELLSKDPYNRLLARGPRFRVEGEIVRDIALAASGLLNPEVGGPSVFPPAPGFLFLPPASYGPKIWKEDTGKDRYRRGLYTFRYRSVPYPVFQNFDAPNGDVSCVRRSRSNTPLQALTTLNETLFLEAARGLAQTTLAKGGSTDRDRLAYAFRRTLSRTPSQAESDELVSLLNRQRDRFLSGDTDPWLLAANDPQNPPALPAETRPADLAAWTAVSRVLLNLDETITKQ